MLDVEDMHDLRRLFDPVDDPIGPAPRAMASGQWTEERFADAIWVLPQSTIAERYDCGGDGLRKAIGDRPPERQIDTHDIWIDADLATSESAQALSDTSDRRAVAENLQSHLETLQIVHREQHCLGLPVTRQRDAFMLLPHAGKHRALRLRFRQRYGVAAVIGPSIGQVSEHQSATVPSRDHCPTGSPRNTAAAASEESPSGHP